MVVRKCGSELNNNRFYDLLILKTENKWRHRVTDLLTDSLSSVIHKQLTCVCVGVYDDRLCFLSVSDKVTILSDLRDYVVKSLKVG